MIELSKRNSKLMKDEVKMSLTKEQEEFLDECVDVLMNKCNCECGCNEYSEGGQCSNCYYEHR